MQTARHREIIEAISENIQARRDRRRLTQRDVADALDMPVGTYSRYDNGATVIPSTDLVRIARALGTSVAYLVGEIDEAAEADQSMLEKFRRLTPARQRIVRDMIESLSAEQGGN